jgi:hypothetical protein
MLGGSSGEGDSSLENSYLSRNGGESSLSAQFRRAPTVEKKKITSFSEEVVTRTLQDRPYESEEVFEESDEEEDHSESAIEDDECRRVGRRRRTQ